MSPVAPTLTSAERSAALERANWVRRERTQLWQDLAGRRADLHALFYETPEWLRAVKVPVLVTHFPTMGPVRTQRLLARLKIAQGKTLGGLSDRQRRELYETLKRRRGAC